MNIYLIINISDETPTTERMIPSGTNVTLAEESNQGQFVSLFL